MSQTKMMGKLFASLGSWFRVSVPPGSAKLGSDGDPIRQMLFASQSLREQVSRIRINGSQGPLQSIVDSYKLVLDGKKSEAIVRLRSVLDSPKIETRTELWVWSGLRELGEAPESKFAFEVLGVIMEVPSGGAYDTLAAYVDGSARYLNFSGRGIFWNAPDPLIKQLCLAFVGSTISASGQTRPRKKLSLPRSGVQVTLLTRSGPFVIVGLAAGVETAGATLMIELIKRAKEKSV